MSTNTQQHDQPQPVTNLQILDMIQNGVPVANIAYAIQLDQVQDTTTRVILRTALAAHLRILEHIGQDLTTTTTTTSQEMQSLKFDDQ